jgi:hypothetical protein
MQRSLLQLTLNRKNWQLATGNWQLATGNWQLAKSFETLGQENHRLSCSRLFEKLIAVNFKVQKLAAGKKF